MKPVIFDSKTFGRSVFHSVIKIRLILNVAFKYLTWAFVQVHKFRRYDLLENQSNSEKRSYQ